MTTTGYRCKHYKSQGNERTDWRASFEVNVKKGKYNFVMICDEEVSHSLGSSEFTKEDIARSFHELGAKNGG